MSARMPMVSWMTPAASAFHGGLEPGLVWPMGGWVSGWVMSAAAMGSQAVRSAHASVRSVTGASRRQLRVAGSAQLGDMLAGDVLDGFGVEVVAPAAEVDRVVAEAVDADPFPARVVLHFGH